MILPTNMTNMQYTGPITKRINTFSKQVLETTHITYKKLVIYFSIKQKSIYYSMLLVVNIFYNCWVTAGLVFLSLASKLKRIITSQVLITLIHSHIQEDSVMSEADDMPILGCQLIKNTYIPNVTALKILNYFHLSSYLY